MSTILKVDDINVYYGSIHAIKGISFEVNEGEKFTVSPTLVAVSLFRVW